jgi:NAD(P)-dependent dehydrogenase (short-subunit alcohol dehydrogenase family)
MSEPIITVTKSEEAPKNPGIESQMDPLPQTQGRGKGSGKLMGKVAIISGGDSGIGKATAIAFAKEGANICIAYLNEHGDAEQTMDEIRKLGRTCIGLAGDIGEENFCKLVAEKTLQELGRIDIVVNNAAQQEVQEDFLKITPTQLERTFKTNIFGYFFLTQAALPHLREGSSIINCTSVTAYRGSEHLIDYSATKGAIVSFTRSLSKALSDKKIRVNGVAPGPVWTPLIPSTFPPEKVEEFGKNVPMGRPAQPEEIAPCFVFLASEDSSYMTGQVLHPNGGEIING